jgi:hypothetical protein
MSDELIEFPRVCQPRSSRSRDQIPSFLSNATFRRRRIPERETTLAGEDVEWGPLRSDPPKGKPFSAGAFVPGGHQESLLWRNRPHKHLGPFVVSRNIQSNHQRRSKAIASFLVYQNLCLWRRRIKTNKAGCLLGALKLAGRRTPRASLTLLPPAVRPSRTGGSLALVHVTLATHQTAGRHHRKRLPGSPPLGRNFELTVERPRRLTPFRPLS